MHTDPKYNVEISNVREVVLLGSADLSYWADRLRPQGLYPVPEDGKAQIIMAATDARFMGVHFREFPISIPVSLKDGGEQDGFYLIHAINTVRFFAFVERTRFGTPYYYGRLDMECTLPASVRLVGKGGSLLEVAMGPSATGRPLADSWIAKDWAQPVFLPVANPGTGSGGNMFYARVRGHARSYRFESDDTFSITPSAEHPVLQWLIDSRFAPTHWCLREGSVHGKSKTVPRRTLRIA